MHAFTTPAALALLAYTSTTSAQFINDMLNSMMASAIQGATNPTAFPTTFSTAIQASPTATSVFDPNNYDPNDCTNPEPYLSME
jgi:fucose permease